MPRPTAHPRRDHWLPPGAPELPQDGEARYRPPADGRDAWARAKDMPPAHLTEGLQSRRGDAPLPHLEAGALTRESSVSIDQIRPALGGDCHQSRELAAL